MRVELSSHLGDKLLETLDANVYREIRSTNMKQVMRRVEKRDWKLLSAPWLDWLAKYPQSFKKFIGKRDRKFHPLYKIIKFDDFRKNIEWWKEMYLWTKNFPHFYPKILTFFFGICIRENENILKKMSQKNVFFRYLLVP